MSNIDELPGNCFLCGRPVDLRRDKVLKSGDEYSTFCGVCYVNLIESDCIFFNKELGVFEAKKD